MSATLDHVTLADLVGTSEPTEIQWTPGQMRARELVLDHVSRGEGGILTIEGYAGTGKTTVITDVLSALSLEPRRCQRCGGSGLWKAAFSRRECYSCEGSGEEPFSVALCAPTHKAAGVLEEKNTIADAHAMTIHSIFACRKTYDGPHVAFVPDWGAYRWGAYRVIVIDEVSMLGPSIWAWIERAVEEYPEIPVICMGDPAQLPPVGEDGCPAWDYTGVTLTEVMRHGGAILDAATAIRTAPEVWHEIAPSGQVVTRYDDIGDWIESAAEAFAAAADAKVVGWTNRTVDWCNARIREVLYPDAPAHAQVDEPRVVIESWSRGPDMLHAECTIVPREVIAETTDTWGLPSYTYRLGGLTVHELADWGQRRYKDQLNQLAAKAKALAAKGDKSGWREFYRLKEHYIRTRPGFATTVHKSQGSTYDHVWVAERDIRRATDDRARLHYVAVTRAAKSLHLI